MSFRQEQYLQNEDLQQLVLNNFSLPESEDKLKEIYKRNLNQK